MHAHPLARILDSREHPDARRYLTDAIEHAKTAIVEKVAPHWIR